MIQYVVTGRPPYTDDLHLPWSLTGDLSVGQVITLTLSAADEEMLIDAGVIARAVPALLGVVTVSSSYPITLANSVVLADATGGAFSIFLPDATRPATFTVKAITAGVNLVTLTPIAGQMIDGAATVPLGPPASTAEYNAVTVLADGTPTWRII